MKIDKYISKVELSLQQIRNLAYKLPEKIKISKPGDVIKGADTTKQIVECLDEIGINLTYAEREIKLLTDKYNLLKEIYEEKIIQDAYKS